MNDKQLRLTVLGAAAVLGLSAIIGTAVVAGAMVKLKSAGDAIAVTGSADRVIKSDTVKWSFRISRQSEADTLKAESATMTADTAKVKSFLKEKGLKDEEITVRPLSVSPMYGSAKGFEGYAGAPQQIRSYNLDQAITVESSRVDEVTAISQSAAETLLAQGVIFTTDMLEYYYSKLPDLKLEMLAAATENAKERAGRIAASTGAELGVLKTASMGVFQVTAVNSTEISDYGAYDTTTLEKRVTAVVRASFAIR
jgi:hypothetical protein